MKSQLDLLISYMTCNQDKFNDFHKINNTIIAKVKDGNNTVDYIQSNFDLEIMYIGHDIYSFTE